MQRRNVFLLILFILVAVSVLMLYRNKPDHTSTVERADSNFKIENIQTIGRVILTQKDGTRSDLRRTGDHWKINDQYRARQSNVDHLLVGIQRQHLDHIPNDAAVKHILPTMAVSGIHVEVFDLEGKEVLNYYVGGVTQDERGTYFLKEGSSQPYCLAVPGFDGGLRARYALAPVDWRDVRFWLEDNDQIDSIRVDYPKMHQHSFVMHKEGNGYEVDPLYSTTPKKNGNTTAIARSYLINLSQLACEDFINDAVERDSILQLVPFMTMDIIYPDHKSYLRFYPIGPVGNSPYSPPVSRYFVDYSGRDFMVGQHEVMKGAFRSYDYFFGQ